MKKKKFIEELRKNLKFLKKEDLEEILGDYEEHFRVGKKKKRSEVEIARSLGNPKEIAKEIREELTQESFNFSGMLNDTFLVMFSHLSESVRGILASIREFFKTDVKDFIETKKERIEEKKERKIRQEKIPKEKKVKTNFWKKFLLTFFNIFVGIWIMISIYIAVGSLFISGIGISVGGFAALVASIVGFFYVIPYVDNFLLVPGIFAGICTMIFGILFSIGSWQLGKVFSRLIRNYMKFNRKIMRGKRE